MKTNTTIFALLLLVAEPCTAVRSFGDPDCGKWFNEVYRVSTRNWLGGYLTGINVMNSSVNKTEDVLGELKSMDQAILWMDNYCKANPLEMVSTGAAVLFNELRAKAHKE